ncbi:MAG: aminotransferase class III-fold pyridoxal phosphate-dependent enzyme, partial [Lysobacterales bacterium]
RYKAGLGPFLSNVHRVPFPYCYRCPIKLDPATCGTACANLLSLVGEADIPPDRIAAVIVEPVLGEGGVVPAPKAFLEEVRRYCDTHGIIFITDEVQSGFGRTGAKFGLDHSGVTADLYVVGKAFSAGFPIAAVVGRSEIMDAMPPGGIGGTFSGNPVICAAGIAAIDIIEDENLMQRAAAIQSIARQEFSTLAERCSLVGDVRCIGALIGIELVTSRDSRAPATDQAGRVVAAAARRGVIVGRGGLLRNVVRLLPPAVIPEDMLLSGLRIVSEAIEEVAGQEAARA